MLIERKSTPESIVAYVIEMIEIGRFPPGSMLPSERDLQAQLGVSRLVLREALARLSALGIVKSRQGKGSFVCDAPSPLAIQQTLIPLAHPVDFDKFDHLIEARAAIEGEIAFLAAENATEHQIQQLEEILHYRKTDLRESDIFSRLDFSFHLKLADIAGNSYLKLMFEAFEPHIREFLVYSSRSVSDRVEAMERHRPIAQAIASRNSNQARDLARLHMDACRDRLNQYIEQLNNE